MQRWAVILQAYNYQVEYRPSTEHGNADALSRDLPCNNPPLKEEAELFFFSALDELPVDARDTDQQGHKKGSGVSKSFGVHPHWMAQLCI